MGGTIRQQQKDEAKGKACLKPFAWLLVFAYMTMIFYFSHQSSDKQPIQTAGPGYAAHMLEYLGLGVLLYLAFHSIGRLSARNVFGFGGVYAATDELHQYFIPTRTAALGDWAADFAGIVVGFFFTENIMKKISTRKKKDVIS